MTTGIDAPQVEAARRRAGPVGTAEIRPGTGRLLRVRTLVLIRWVAVAGQLATVLAVRYALGFDLPLSLCLAAIAVSALSNVVLTTRYPAQSRLGEREASIVLGFDVLQLAVLLFLTGGLDNPFALLILAPVTVAATILPRWPTIVLVALALVCVTVLAYFHHPLPWGEKGGHGMPLLYSLAIWTALAVAAVFISTYLWSVAEEARQMSDALAATQASLGREQRLAALGGLAAAAAHELGSPLATIAVVARELSREAPPDSPYAEDLNLLMSEAARCREILARLSRRPEETGSGLDERMPLSILVEAAAEPHLMSEAAIDVVIDDASPPEAEPMVRETPELLHGLGNLIQNAVQYAREEVTLTLSWDAHHVRLLVADDGPGFAPAVLGMLGEPYVSTRRESGGYMGLGVFIAQTLLERQGARLSFRNRPGRAGAEVAIAWPREVFEAG